MSTPAEKLAESLVILKDLRSRKNNGSIRSKDISRTHRERLVQNGFLKEVFKGWYIVSRPEEKKGDSTFWYNSYWGFMSDYLNFRFDENWCVSSEQSILLHSGNLTVPNQLLVKSPQAQNNLIKLPHNTSMFDAKLSIPSGQYIEIMSGIRVYSLPLALVSCSDRFFNTNPTESAAALSLIKDSSDILSILLEEGQTVVAGRLAGAFRNIGRDNIADEIIQTMGSLGENIRENDPFEAESNYTFTEREISPHSIRLKIMWSQMREAVLKHFPKAPGMTKKIDEYMKNVEDIYKSDAYHSLSIEGYSISDDLIEKVRSGNWDIEKNPEDLQQKNAMVARGYWQAFKAVSQSIKKVLSGQSPGEVAGSDHGEWYRQLFAPGVTAGLFKPSDLAGYRNSQVYISSSKHIPMNKEAVRDAMPTLIELLKNEQEPSVRAVLGHFFFVYIHPYMDGNGRTARFLMNVMLSSGGYPWLIIPVEDRDVYMNSLEKASIEGDITDFVKFLATKLK